VACFTRYGRDPPHEGTANAENVDMQTFTPDLIAGKQLQPLCQLTCQSLKAARHAWQGTV
jgi:hypothetical protein